MASWSSMALCIAVYSLALMIHFAHALPAAENCDVDSAVKGAPLNLVIASHNRLFIHDAESGKHRTLHTGEGVYYSVFESNKFRRLWVATRPDTNDDSLLEIDMTVPSLDVTEKVPLPSKFTHEVIRYEDRVFVADTSTGSILVLSFPELALVRRISKFSAKDHINTLAVDDNGKSIWAVFHNRGSPSFVVKFDVASGDIIKQVNNLANQAHGWIEYPLGSSKRIVLSSGDASLIHFDLKTETSQVLFTSSRHSPKRRMFLKGVTVVDDVAYFGESELRDRAGRATVSCTLIAFDLKQKKVLFERSTPGSIGLINTIGVLGMRDASYKAVVSPLPRTDHLVPRSVKGEYIKSLLQDARSTGFAYGTFPNNIDVVRLPFNFPIGELQREVENLIAHHGGWISRPDVNNWFVLLMTKDGIRDDQSNFGPFDEVESRLKQSPMMRRIFRSLGIVVGRTRLMMLKPGEKVKPHFDKTNHFRPTGEPDISGGYWGRRFRIHIPIFTDPGNKVRFYVGETALHFAAGGAYIFDNTKVHGVANDWDKERVHLVIDTVGGPRLFESILRNSEAEFYPPRGPLLKYDSQFKPVFSQMDVALPDFDGVGVLKERWIDEAVFQPMKEPTARMYLVQHVLKDLVRAEDKDTVSKLFERFLYVWKNVPVGLDVWQELLAPILASEIVLVNGLELIEAVEPIARMLLYQCNRDTKKETDVGPPCVIIRSRTMPIK